MKREPYQSQLKGQMALEDVVDSELVGGDSAYTAWVKAGRPRLDHNTALAVLQASPYSKRSSRRTETLPGV